MASLHEVYEDAQHVYIVMENCKGGDLETLLAVCSFVPHAISQTLYFVITTIHA